MLTLPPSLLPPSLHHPKVTPLHVMSALVAEDDSMGTGIVRASGKWMDEREGGREGGGREGGWVERTMPAGRVV